MKNCHILDHHFVDNEPKKYLLTDIIYIPFNDCFIYFSTILDTCTKEVLTYKYSLSLKIDFVKETLIILIEEYGNELTNETIIHSNQGSHYIFHVFIDIVEEMNLIRSISRKGNCWDNARQESFFGHMKDEIGDLTKQSNDDCDVYKILDDWIDYYNTDRLNTNFASKIPVEYYQYLLNGGEIIRSKKYKRKRKILKIKLYSNLSLTLGTVHYIFVLKFHFRKIRFFHYF